jgi:hypothetical protein
MSDAVRTQIGIVEEVTIGTTPATPAFETLRVTVPNLNATKQTKISNELRSDRQITDRITVGFQSGGDIAQEVSYGAMDSLIRGGMQSEWVWAPVRDNNGTADSIITDVTATDVTVLATNGTQYRSGVFAVGHLVRTTGFTAAGNNGLRRAGAGTTGTVIKLAGGTIDAAPAAAARAKAIGFEGASGDITATANGLGSTALDFTTLGLVVGMWLWIGGPIAGQAFATAACRGWARISAIARPSRADLRRAAGWLDNGCGRGKDDPVLLRGLHPQRHHASAATRSNSSSRIWPCPRTSTTRAWCRPRWNST